MLTYNQVTQRIKVIATAHKQIRNFYSGDIEDFLTDKTTLYASCFLNDLPGASSIDPINNQATYVFQMWLLDLVDVSLETKKNEQDVQSDMFSVAADLIAEINFSGYPDWKISTSVPVSFLYDVDHDILAGVLLTLSIATPYDQDVCQVPTNPYSFPIIDNDMKPVYDIVYVSDGTEGDTITVPEIEGKKILLLIRESFPQFQVTAFDANQSTEYLWADSPNPLVDIKLGTDVNPDGGERFLILYRNY